MAQFVDRRLNPRDKSLGNRQRFLRRTRAEIKRAVDKAVADRGHRRCRRRRRGFDPEQRHRRAAVPSLTRQRRARIRPARQQGIRRRRPHQQTQGWRRRRRAGREGADSGGGEDAFAFALSEAEFLDILFEDLELPDLVKASLKETSAREFRRAGYANDGATPNLAVLRTMRVSMSRRLALRRPTNAEVERLEAELEALRAKAPLDLEVADQLRIGELYAEIERLRRRKRAVPFIDPIDVRYNRFAPTIVPRAKAVMFCLMDVSASMGEREKDLAKRFYMLLHLFLKRRYERVDIVFIRHTHEAEEVDEQEFFYGRETGGTVVSTALKTMIAARKARYAPPTGTSIALRPRTATIRAAMRGLRRAARRSIMPLSQYYAYIEIADERATEHSGRRRGTVARLRRARGLCSEFRQARVAGRADIFPVFRELFARQPKQRAST